jgi:hypothetical protein
VKPKVGWADAIQRAFAQEADVVPEGWMTLEQVAGELKKNKFHTCKLLNKMIRMGGAETRKFRTWVKGSRDARGPRRGYLRTNRHYRIISPRLPPGEAACRASRR